MRATDERRYVVGFCSGALTVDGERLTIQGEPHENGRDRAPVVIERADVAMFHLRCGLLGATLERELPSGYRSDVIRTGDWHPLLEDLLAQGWPVQTSGLRRPR